METAVFLIMMVTASTSPASSADVEQTVVEMATMDSCEAAALHWLDTKHRITERAIVQKTAVCIYK